MSNIKLSKGNFTKFTEKIFISPDDFDINKIIYMSGNKPKLPMIPGMYFKKRDNNGFQIINIYFNIKLYLEQLLKIKEYILFILSTTKIELQKIKSTPIYKFNKNNLIEDLSKLFENEDEFIIFKELYVTNKYNIFKTIKSEIPLFIIIFQDLYNGDSVSKKYFIRLLKKYNKIRKKILKYINDDYGINAFKSFFEFDDVMSLQNNIKKEKKKIRNKEGNDIRYELMKNTVDTNTSAATSVATPTALLNKLSSFKTLYINNVDKKTVIGKHSQNIDTIYKNLNNSLNNIYDNDNLYDLTINALDSDYYVIQLLFNYVDKVIFSKKISENYTIKKSIYDKINIFENYYDDYMEWYSKISDSRKKQNNENRNIDAFKLDDFEYIFDTIVANTKK